MKKEITKLHEMEKKQTRIMKHKKEKLQNELPMDTYEEGESPRTWWLAAAEAVKDREEEGVQIEYFGGLEALMEADPEAFEGVHFSDDEIPTDEDLSEVDEDEMTVASTGVTGDADVAPSAETDEYATPPAAEERQAEEDDARRRADNLTQLLLMAVVVLIIIWTIVAGFELTSRKNQIPSIPPVREHFPQSQGRPISVPVDTNVDTNDMVQDATDAVSLDDTPVVAVAPDMGEVSDIPKALTETATTIDPVASTIKTRSAIPFLFAIISPLNGGLSLNIVLICTGEVCVRNSFCFFSSR